MGTLVEGVWTFDMHDAKTVKGAFQRRATAFHNWVTLDGAAGPTGEDGFKAEAGRYHLYISLACPWAHRTLIMRALKGLEDTISLSIVDPLMLENGWTFSEAPGCIPDTVNGFEFVHQIYTASKACYTGRVSVPVLWDNERNAIVNNESSEIIRMFNSAFVDAGASGVDYFPEPLRPEIDAINAVIFENVNNGVYKSGFARAQEAYDAAFEAVFETLDTLEDRLAGQRYLVDGQITEADWRLFPTLVRFDSVYHSHFKCNRNRIVDYPNLWGYTRELYQVPGIAGTVDHDHIKRHYFASQTSINPSQVVAKGPVLDFAAPHGRDSIGSAAA